MQRRTGFRVDRSPGRCFRQRVWPGLRLRHAGGWNAVLAPKGTPRDTILQINQAVRASLDTPKVRQILERSGAEEAATAPDEFAAFLKAEVVKWGKVIKAAGIKLK